MVILCLFPSKAFAELGLIKTPDGHVRLAGVISSRPNGIITAKVIGGNYVHGTAESLSLRSAASGAVSSTKVPATISRTASLAKVAQNIHGKLRYARFTPQALVGSLILGEILDSLIEQGYTYDEASGNMMSGGQYLVCAFRDGNECIDLNFERFHQPLDSRNIYMTLSDVSPSSLQQVCDRVTKRNMRFNSPSDFGEEVLSSNYISSYGACFVEFRVVKPFTGYKVGDVYTASIRVGTLFVGSRPLSDSDLHRILEPIAAQNPEAVLQAADLSDSDWSAPKVHVLPGTIVNSQPFTDPKDGRPKQIRWEFYDCEDGQSCVRETLTDRPDLQPNSPAAPAPDNPPASGTDTAPGSGSGSNAGNNTGSGNQSGNEGQQEKDDLCRKYPHIMACDEQPEPGSYDLSIPHETVNLSFSPDNVFSTDAACPAGATFEAFGGRYSFSMQPACDLARTLRPFLIAMAWLVAAFFVARTVRAAV